ncbi:MAG: hypothetical protein DLM58_21895 [Pseudonocardiales bacterium]|nr:MAG: hypothetical protein DLM58_21895 [Pseudonocardiales bacterium]
MAPGRTIITAAITTVAACGAGLALLATPAGAATPSTSPAPSAQAAACDRAPWAGRIQGAPAGLSAGARGGDYLWHDTHGFHLRVTHHGYSRQVFTGVITSATAMRIDPVRLERGDVVKLSADHRTLAFAFVDYGYIDGVNFHTDCSPAITVSRLHVGNAALPVDRVYLGHTKAHPAHIPFTIHRQVV